MLCSFRCTSFAHLLSNSSCFWCYCKWDKCFDHVSCLILWITWWPSTEAGKLGRTRTGVGGGGVRGQLVTDTGAPSFHCSAHPRWWRPQLVGTQACVRKQQVEHSDGSVGTGGERKQLVSEECANRWRGPRHRWAGLDSQKRQQEGRACQPTRHEIVDPLPSRAWAQGIWYLMWNLGSDPLQLKR